jgi:hypothetical protein
MNPNYDWYLHADLERFAGKWIVIANQKVIGSGANVKKMFAKAKEEYPDETPIVAKIPKPGLMVL